MDQVTRAISGGGVAHGTTPRSTLAVTEHRSRPIGGAPATSSGARPGGRDAVAGDDVAPRRSSSDRAVARLSASGRDEGDIRRPCGARFARPGIRPVRARRAVVSAGRRRRRRSRVAIDRLRRIEGDAVLPDDTHLLRQLDAAHRPRVHDDRGRRPRASSTAAGEDTFFLTVWTSTRQGRACRRGEGARRPGVRRPDRRRVAGAARAPERVERLLHPHERRGPQGVRPGLPRANPTTA